MQAVFDTRALSLARGLVIITMSQVIREFEKLLMRQVGLFDELKE